MRSIILNDLWQEMSLKLQIYNSSEKQTNKTGPYYEFYQNFKK